MCGRYGIYTPPDELGARFAATSIDLEPTYNAAPRERLPVIRDDADDAITTARWGLVPEWADDDSTEFINARAETLAEKPSFRDAYARSAERDSVPSAGRCLVLADGFYEWVEEGDGRKQPYYVTRRDDEPFAMAGLWSRWTPTVEQTDLSAFGAGEPAAPDPVETFAIVTTEPNEVVEELHHRMAAILPGETEREWLADAEVPAPIDGDELRAYPVSTRVNSPANDGPELVEEVAHA
ncbi:SOS response-associated peptidase [Halalkalicoccus ordinarius]|uniref:SOS response-associated peptidase n=1 Tax=Halalkalicoccus ordinarius TaxID=3116651 RepID=UPI00300F5D8D